MTRGGKCSALLTVVGAASLAAVTWAAYANTFHVPLHFDDAYAIGANASLQHWLTAWSPPAGTTVGGRPVLNVSFALNYAWDGLDLTGYHALNLIIHVLAGLTLWGILRRTLARRSSRPASQGGPTDAGRTDSTPTAPAFLIALIWTLHPLQTEAVTYLSQRAESLMGLFYLLTIYCFVRGAVVESAFAPPGGASADKKAGERAGWLLLSWVACLFGMATKEVMVSAPLIVLLYDRTFVAGSFAAAWRCRSKYYAALAATWLPLIYLVARAGGNRGGSTGFGAGVFWGNYELSQIPALVHYLRLVFWPHPLIFDYGPGPIPFPPALVAAAAVVAGAVALTVAGLVRRSPWAFLGAWFFALLAPTSLVPGALQRISEHRMYLASAAVICAAVLLADSVLVRSKGPWARRCGVLAALTAAGVCAVLTFARNRDYRSGLALWSDTVAKRPAHALAHYNLANELSKTPAGIPAALAEYRTALELDPRQPQAQYNLAVLLEAIPGREGEAVAHYRQALVLDPNDAAVHNNLGAALVRQGHPGEAVEHFAAALRLVPDSEAICRNLANTLAMSGRDQEAVDYYERALRLDPNDGDTQHNFGLVLQQLGRKEEAEAHLALAERLAPGR